MREGERVVGKGPIIFIRRTCQYRPPISTHTQLCPARFWFCQNSSSRSRRAELMHRASPSPYEGKSHSPAETSNHFYSENLPVPSPHLHTHPAMSCEILVLPEFQLSIAEGRVDASRKP